jgi:hypothetical protein
MDLPDHSSTAAVIDDKSFTRWHADERQRTVTDYCIPRKDLVAVEKIRYHAVHLV